MEDLNLTPMQGRATLIQNAYRAPIDREESEMLVALLSVRSRWVTQLGGCNMHLIEMKAESPSRDHILRKPQLQSQIVLLLIF